MQMQILQCPDCKTSYAVDASISTKDYQCPYVSCGSQSDPKKIEIIDVHSLNHLPSPKTSMKFEIYKWENGGVIMRFTNSRGTSESWFSSPPQSIDHVGIRYLKNRFRNVRDVRHERFIKQQYKELIGAFISNKEETN